MDFGVFVPPIFRRLRSRPSMKVYDSYDSALADSNTYEDPGIIEVVSNKTKAFRRALEIGDTRMANNRQIVQNMFVLSHVSSNRPVEVLEVGGACGASYLELNHLLPGTIKRWHIVETPAMAAAGRKLFHDGRPSFYDDLDKAASQLESLDLVIAQGVLQYMKDPVQTLEALLKLGFAYFYITRTEVGDSIERPIITKEVSNISAHGPGTVAKEFADRKTSVPLTIVSSEAITSRISVGYNVLYSFIESEDRFIIIGSRPVTTRTVGFLFEKVY